MRDVRLQYFLAYGLFGAVLPYVSVFFKSRGLSDLQVGYAYSIWSAAFVLSPVLVTLAADTKADPRRLMVLDLALSAITLLALGFVRGVGPILGVWALHCLAAFPLMPLMDGVCFSLQRRREEHGLFVRPFHQMRVWGSVGYMTPGILLYVLLGRGMSIQGALMSGAAFAILSAIQALFLEDPRAATSNEPSAVGPSKLPTLGAAAVLLQPALLGFAAAVFLGQMATTIYGAYYAIYLTDTGHVGLAPRWVGIVTNLGVIVEIIFISSTGRLVEWCGLRPLMALSLLFVAARMGLLAISSHPAVGIGTQLFHGVQMVGLTIAPQMFADRLATDRMRHSMQGVLILLIGLGRAAGGVTGGMFARHGLSNAFVYSAVLCVAAAICLLAFNADRESSTFEVVTKPEPSA